MNSYNQSTIKTLTDATQSLTIQNEIQSILNSIITDIEVKNELETYINHEIEMKQLQRKCYYAELALEEYKMMEREKEKKNRALVDDFVNDLCSLSCVMDELQSIKKNSAISNDDDDARAQKNGGNDSFMANSISASAGNISITDTMHKEKALSTLETNKDTVTEDKNELTNEANGIHDENPRMGDESGTKDNEEVCNANSDENLITSNPSVSIKNVSETVPTVDESIPLPQITNQLEDKETSTTPTPAAITATIASPTQTIIPKKRTKKIKKRLKRLLPPTLQSLHSTTLMSIFEYMDAIDIVNLAQTNVLMYSKVDSLFGLGGAGFDADGRDADLAYEECSIEEEIEVEVEVEDYDDNDKMTSHLIRPTSDQSFSSGSGSEQQQQQPHATIVSIPSSMSTTAKVENKSNETPPVSTPKTQNLTQRKSSENSLSKIATNEDVSTETKSVTKNTPSSSSSTTTTGSFQLSSAVAAALADKLSPMELSAIITMREQLRAREIEMAQMSDELKNLNAKFEGTMSVNEVLTVKVKEQQLALDQNKDIAAKMNRQMSSDQEVIAFLDERVQELERHVHNFDDERGSLRNEMDKIKKASEKQLSVLGDMLTFEREQMADNEKEWKTAKKLLVKEVKHCRAQILALEAERDGYCEENAKLKEALLSVGSMSKSSKSFDLAL